MKYFLFIFLMGFIFSGCTVTDIFKNKVSETDVSIVTGKAIESVVEDEADVIVYQYLGLLNNVADGNSSGTAAAGYDETYNLYAQFTDLPDPDENYFYEGWVLRKSPFSFISTGVVDEVNGVYTNVYNSKKDYTDYDFYVLTIEPTNDGENGKPDPAPAKHILEGLME